MTGGREMIKVEERRKVLPSAGWFYSMGNELPILPGYIGRASGEVECGFEMLGRKGVPDIGWVILVWHFL